MKIEEQVLSREQMAHLKELGVDTSDASMYWTRAERMEGFKKHNPIDNDLGKWRLSLSRKLIVPAAWKVEYIPTYTIGDLIGKLPKIIGFKFSCASYRYERNNFAAIRYRLLHTHDADLKEDLYKALCWVAENHKELIK